MIDLELKYEKIDLNLRMTKPACATLNVLENSLHEIGWKSLLLPAEQPFDPLTAPSAVFRLASDNFNQQFFWSAQ